MELAELNGELMYSAVKMVSKELGLSEATVRRAVSLLRDCNLLNCGSHSNKGVQLSFTKLGKILLDELRGDPTVSGLESFRGLR